MPETRVKQVQDSVLHPAHVQVHPAGVVRSVLGGPRTHPVLLVALVAELLAIVRIGVAQLVPGTAGPLRHDIGVAGVGLQTLAEIEVDVHPAAGLVQRRRRFTVGIIRVEQHRRVVGDIGQFDWKHRIGQRVRTSVGVVNDGKRLAPISLAGEQPVAQLVLDAGPAAAVGLQPGGDRRLGLPDVKAVEIIRIDQLSVTRVGLKRNISPGDHFGDRQAELKSELPVPLVMTRHCHDGAGTVPEQHVVGDEHRNLLAIDRIGGVAAQEHARLGLVLLAFEVGFGGDPAAVGDDGLSRRLCSARPARVDTGGPPRRDYPVDQFVFGCQNKIVGAEQGVRSGSEHFDVGVAHREQRRCACGTADPVALHGLDLVRPVQHLEILEQPIGVGSNSHHPLPQPLPKYREVAALAAAIGGHFLVGQHRPQTGAPIDEGVRPVHQPMAVDDVGALPRRQIRPLPAIIESFLPTVEFGDQLVDAPGLVELWIEPGVVDLQEDPLGPGVEVDVGGGEAAALIMPEPEPAELAPEIDDVGFGAGARVRAGLNRVLLGG